uniref:Peptide ABC transporter substrate-binding protein n=1 Tax=Eiseniibacteriota bacterium TaxID=2212470 RepID=A0A832MJ09_UNCEI
MLPRSMRVILAALAALSLAALACAPDRRGAGARHAHYFGDVSPPRGQVFRYNNGAEPESWDPGLCSGQPDGRVARALFEGLAVPNPRTLQPEPGMAERWTVSDDGLVYTFRVRSGTTWSDGTPFTAEDFRWSWLRVLRPGSGARYASLLYPIRNAEAFHRGALADEAAVGVAAPDDTTLVVTLESPTPYFVFLTMFYTYCPVPRHVVERYGNRWTRPEHVVSNGAFILAAWRQGDRFEFVRNPRYWDAAHVRLERIVAYSVDDLNTSANLYKAGVIDWTTSGAFPSQFVPYLRAFRDYQHGLYQGTYFYSFNVSEPPLDNVWLRRALSLAVDREAIARDLLKGSRAPWGNLCPTGYPGYVHPPGHRFDPDSARACLARAGYPGGRGVPKLSLLFNTSEDHRRIAEAIQAMWRRELNVEVELSNQEWGSYLQATTALEYQIARRAWIGDYLDPNTFLSCFVTGDGNNRTGWSDAVYDRLVREAARTLDPARRLAILAEAEARLLDQAPIIPIYHYSTNDLVKPYVRGIWPTALDTHPLKHVWIDHDWRMRAAGAAANGAALGEAR